VAKISDGWGRDIMSMKWHGWLHRKPQLPSVTAYEDESNNWTEPQILPEGSYMIGATSPITDPVGGEQYFDTELGTELFYDVDKNKWISKTHMFMEMSKEAVNIAVNSYLHIGNAGASTLCGSVMTRDGIVLSASLCASNNPALIRTVSVWRGPPGTNIESMIDVSIASGEYFSYNTTVLGSTFNAGDLLKPQVTIGGQLDNPILILELAWTRDAYPDYDITGGIQGSKIFYIAGDHTSDFPTSSNARVIFSTGNNEDYTVASSTYNAGETRTEITINEVIPSATLDGKIVALGV